MVSLISLVILVIASIILINLILKTWVFTKADDSFYYPTLISCEQTTNPDGSAVARPAECSDPNYEEKERKAEETRRAAQKQRDASQALAMILVATPVFYYHWKLARKEA
jgi:ABC-type oligopeptide transport system substrate-binding subunit